MSKTTTNPSKRFTTWKKLVYTTLLIAITTVIVFIGYFLYSTAKSLPANVLAFQSTISNGNVNYTDKGSYYALTPKTTAISGLVIYPGAFTDPRAYVTAYSELTKANIAVYIIKSPLNFPLLNPWQANEVLADNGSISSWFVAGHSLGGVAACEYSKQNEEKLNGFILLASYCNGDAMDLNIPILSISASNDGLSTPNKISASKKQLPDSTEFVTIEGANHTQFGIFTKTQPGDKAPTIAQSAAQKQINNEIIRFIQKYQ